MQHVGLVVDRRGIAGQEPGAAAVLATERQKQAFPVDAVIGCQVGHEARIDRRLLREASVIEFLEHHADRLRESRHRVAAQVAADMTHAVGALRDDEIVIVELEIEQYVRVGLARVGFQHIAQARQAAFGECPPRRMRCEQALGADLDSNIVSHPVLNMRLGAAVGDAAFAAARGDDRRPETGSAGYGLLAWGGHQVLSAEPHRGCPVRDFLGSRAEHYDKNRKSIMLDNFKWYNFFEAHLITRVRRRPRHCDLEPTSRLHANLVRRRREYKRITRGASAQMRGSSPA